MPVLDRIVESVAVRVRDPRRRRLPEDTTVPVRRAVSPSVTRGCATLVNTYGRGPANAIRYGIDQVTNPVVVVTMADGSDDPRQIDDLARLVNRGVVVAAASRYSAGGQQVGGPLFKGLLSRGAGRSLRHVRPGRHPGRDEQLQGVLDRVHPRGRHPQPERLRDRARADRQGSSAAPAGGRAADHLAGPRRIGESNFDLRAWIPKYLRWYRFAFGPPLSLDEVSAARVADRRRSTTSDGTRLLSDQLTSRRSSSPARPASSAATSSRSCCAAATASSASTTTPSTARSRSPTTTTPTTTSSRTTPATCS